MNDRASMLQILLLSKVRGDVLRLRTFRWMKFMVESYLTSEGRSFFSFLSKKVHKISLLAFDFFILSNTIIQLSVLYLPLSKF